MWRYYVCDHVDSSDLPLLLDKMGASGWELISSYAYQSGIRLIYHLIFKCPA